MRDLRLFLPQVFVCHCFERALPRGELTGFSLTQREFAHTKRRPRRQLQQKRQSNDDVRVAPLLAAGLTQHTQRRVLLLHTLGNERTQTRQWRRIAGRPNASDSTSLCWRRVRAPARPIARHPLGRHRRRDRAK